MIEDIQVSITPDALKPGTSVTLEASLVGDVAAASSVRVSVQGYGYTQYLTSKGEGRFSLQTTVPWEADSGTYHLSFSAMGSDGSTLKSVSVPVRVA